MLAKASSSSLSIRLRLLRCRRHCPRSLITVAAAATTPSSIPSSIPFNPSHNLQRKMSFHFGSQEYARAFLNLPTADTKALRQQTLDYLKYFDASVWYDDPVVSLLKGQKLPATSIETETKDALGNVNGRQIFADEKQIETLKEHIRTFQSPYTDLRTEIRTIEGELLHNHAGALIGNQCLDFQKQDGITEMEESVMANAVERRLNDLLLQQEQQGHVVVNRKPIYVSCVSNFTNFLDLFRKTIRSLELGIPCIVLTRSNAQQHAYRWTLLLQHLMQQQQIDPGMLTFLSCDLSNIKEILSSCQDYTGNLYTTCSRQLAKEIKSNYPNTVASTGGPNTLVTTQWNKQVSKAVQQSASIESSGQCTALRHVVVPPNGQTKDEDFAKHVFDGVKHLDSAVQAVNEAVFDGVFPQHQGTSDPPSSYRRHEAVDACFKVSDALPEPGINEYWRKVVVDFTRLDINNNQQDLDKLAVWLNQNQPITLAVNGPRNKALKLGMTLFDKTGMVVNTIGSTDDSDMPPALTCQARPQEAEVFGEFPPRPSLKDYTKFPVVVPSSNPSYDATYTRDYLLERAKDTEGFGTSTKSLLDEISDDATRGYVVALIRYLQDASRMNPKVGFGSSRTAVWGLQRPPLGTKAVLRCEPKASWDCVCPIYSLFHVTNARPQLELSIDPANDRLVSLCMANKLEHTIETREAMTSRLEDREDIFNTVIVSETEMTDFPMAGNFVSVYLPLGHLKSTKPSDEEFILVARLSNKWLNTLF